LTQKVKIPIRINHDWHPNFSYNKNIKENND
jgi:hypothetical protein